MRVLVIGAGGHGQVTAQILLALRAAGRDVQPLGFVDADPELRGRFFLGLPVLGAGPADAAHDALVVAIGDNARRRRLFEDLVRAGETLFSAVHPSAVLAPDAVLGPGCMLCPGVVVNAGAVIAADTILNTGCIVEHHCQVGPHAHIAPAAALGGECAVGEEALVGMGAVVLPRLRLGARAVVGAGAVVVRDVPADARVRGVPAR